MRGEDTAYEFRCASINRLNGRIFPKLPIIIKTLKSLFTRDVGAAG
jgi:hypothetical protein